MEHEKDQPIASQWVEQHPDAQNLNRTVTEEDELHGFQTDLEHLPAGYYRSSFFLGTMFAVGFGLCAAVGGFGLAAPALSLINSEIGPDPNISWVSFVYTLTLSIALLLVGRLSDLFGRRWFMIGGTCVALIGCIVSAVAQSVPTLIAGIALIGLGAGAQQSFSFVSNELVPMKYRFMINGWIYLWCFPTGGFGAAVSKAFILYTPKGWRTCFYLLIALNVTSGVLYFFFYHPPTFGMKHRIRTKSQMIKMFDYVGAFLFVGGLIIFEIGLLWGGGVYSWASAHVLAPLLVGVAIIVIFVLWELYAPLKEPILPMKLFKNPQYVAASVLLGLGASVYYAMAIIWPEMVAVLFTDDGGASMRAGWLNSIPGFAIVIGQVSAGALSASIGKQKFQCMAVLSLGGAFLAAMAYSKPSTLVGSACLIALASLFIGWNESVCLTNAGIEVEDQQEIGTAVGMAGSIRSAISTVASSVYVVVLTNRLKTTIPAEVPKAVVAAGLPASSVVAFLTGFTTGDFSNIPGLTPKILATGTAAYKLASAHAYSTVFLTSIAFTGVALIITIWAPNVDDKLTVEVATTLHEKAGTIVGEGTGAGKTSV
ncbi:fungal trichothecene efflux pump [Exophiala viscosa]|uniref:Fungal trichothecene efflux pump n=1 Tax=Exophiala viscosa TaxID=2486360 RepID=A0AAN6DXA3_9EURO|nr:fungal trichothecene efflux pump [Exophiala viscosa]